MSGFAGVLRMDDAPVDLDVLGRMADSLALRGPDASSSWHRGPVGLTHSLLIVSEESEGEVQPMTLDGHHWIVAHARIDARADLIRKLASRGRQVATSATDAELILHAYHAWKGECTEHLLGDFSFAIVNPEQKTLFCARDHLGVRPFFYALVNGQLIWSNTLNTLREHPEVSDAVDDSAIADFLLFGYNRNFATTTFADIHRLPPAHQLHWIPGRGVQIKRYWTFTHPEEVRLKRKEEYRERFQELFGTAVADRVRTDRIGISLSGGLDSPSVAVEVARILKKSRPSGKLWAQTFVFDRLIPDEERHYAGLVSAALGIEHDFVALDDYPCRDGFWDSPEAQGPEPEPRTFCRGRQAGIRRAVAQTRVVMSGEGADEGLREPQDYFLALLREGRWGRWGLDVARHIGSHHRLPPHRVRATLRRIRHRRDEGPPPFPSWLNPEFSRDFHLHERWNDHWQAEKRLANSRRSGLFYVFDSAHLPLYFEGDDAGVTGAPIEYYFPFFDLRVLRFLMSVPTVPWKSQKHLLRTAMQGALPDAILHRPKAALAGDPEQASGAKFPIEWQECMRRSPELGKYFRSKSGPLTAEAPGGAGGASSVWFDSMPFELASWWHCRKGMKR